VTAVAASHVSIENSQSHLLKFGMIFVTRELSLRLGGANKFSYLTVSFRKRQEKRNQFYEGLATATAAAIMMNPKTPPR
jgi:hypothetical protein